MKYPYIGEDKDNGNITLFTGENKGVVVKNKAFELGSCSNHWAEYVFKNITTEYLANTYGEVKSKEHAEFIVKLNSGKESSIGESWSDRIKCFIIDGAGKLCFSNNVYSIDKDGKREITIPLPPECESVDEWPKVGDEVTWGTKAVNGEVKGIDNGLAWIKNDHGNYNTVHISDLQKPKTPEQELREFLHLLWRENNEDFDGFADIAVLHLTKKGEGDE